MTTTIDGAVAITSDGVIDPFRVRALAAALNLPLPAGDELPLTWHWAQLPEVPAATGEDGHPAKGGFLPDVGLPRRMWAASEIDCDRPLRIGRPARRVSTIVASREKAGRTGRLHFVEVEHVWTQDDAHCLTERQTLVYREPVAPGDAPAAPPPAEPLPVLRTLTPDPVLLFRYSALTYNGHRIHYDLPYAREVEGYPALVVHGPLLATLLLGAAVHDGRVSRFAFRAERPAFAGRPLTLTGRRDGEELTMASVDDDGRVTMRAQATLRGDAGE